MTTVPPGSVLINPDNGTPYLNSDGSVYLFDPTNPPRLSPLGQRYFLFHGVEFYTILSYQAGKSFSNWVSLEIGLCSDKCRGEVDKSSIRIKTEN